MAQKPMLAHDSQYYKIINRALLENGYTSMAEFFEKEFIDYFSNSEWTELLDVGEANYSGMFTQVIGGKKVPILAAITADDGDAPLMGTEGAKVQSIDIFRSKLAYTYNEKSVAEADHLLRNGARIFNYKSVFDNFVLDNAILIESINVARSYAAFRMESTGKLNTTVENKAGGMVGVNIDYQIPGENRKKAGFKTAPKVVWSDISDPDNVADPIQDLVDLFRFSKYNKEGSVFRMSQATWDSILDHPSTKKRLAMYKTGYMISEANVPSFILLEGEVKDYLSRLGLPAIQLVTYVAKSQAVDPNSNRLVHTDLQAFDDNVVLLRPTGKIGFYDWKPVTNMFSTEANPMFYAEENKTSIQQLIYTAEKSAKMVAEAIGAPNPYDVSEWFYLKTDEVAS